MENTIEESLQSILQNVTDDFEVLVVDESTDNSRDVVKKVQQSHDNLRLVELDPDPDRNLGKMRNIGIQEARGDFVLIYVDADDRYNCGITDFAEIYLQMRESLGHDFYLSGGNINISSRDFLLNKAPHRNLPISAAEEDFEIRLQNEDDVIYLTHDSFSEEIDKPERKKSKFYGFKRSFEATVARFQMGTTFRSLFKYTVITDERLTLMDRLVYLIVLPLAYLVALPKERYEIPSDFRDYRERDRRRPNYTYTLEEIEEQFGITFDRDELSDCGKDVFL